MGLDDVAREWHYFGIEEICADFQRRCDGSFQAKQVTPECEIRGQRVLTSPLVPMLRIHKSALLSQAAHSSF